MPRCTQLFTVWFAKGGGDGLLFYARILRRRNKSMRSSPSRKVGRIDEPGDIYATDRAIPLPPPLLSFSLFLSQVSSRLNALHAQMHRYNPAPRLLSHPVAGVASRGGRIQCEHRSLDIHLREPYARMHVVRNCEKYGDYRKGSFT